MSTLSKSPLAVARAALAVGQKTLRAYSHRYSPHTYTQPQLFACLVLKTFFRTDYRGIEAILQDSGDLCDALDLFFVPHFTTLQKASARLLRQPRARRLFRRTVRLSYGRRRRLRRAALDSTGLEYGQRSSYYVRRRNSSTKHWQTVAYSRFAKLEAAIDCANHFLLAVLVGRGPRPDINRFVPLLDATLAQVRPATVLADAGYDSEANHCHARERRAVRSFMPAKHGRPTSKLPSGRHRRRMKQRLNKHYGGYGQRWQVETGFSMIKRRISNLVRAHTYGNQRRELLLIALTYNIMLLCAAAAFLQSNPRPLFRLAPTFTRTKSSPV